MTRDRGQSNGTQSNMHLKDTGTEIPQTTRIYSYSQGDCPSEPLQVTITMRVTVHQDHCKVRQTSRKRNKRILYRWTKENQMGQTDYEAGHYRSLKGHRKGTKPWAKPDRPTGDTLWGQKSANGTVSTQDPSPSPSPRPSPLLSRSG